jgi:hypothetical protein
MRRVGAGCRDAYQGALFPLPRSLHPFAPLIPHTDDLRHALRPAVPETDPEATKSSSDFEDASSDIVEPEPDAETQRQQFYTANIDRGPSVVSGKFSVELKFH